MDEILSLDTEQKTHEQGMYTVIVDRGVQCRQWPDWPRGQVFIHGVTSHVLQYTCWKTALAGF